MEKTTMTANTIMMTFNLSLTSLEQDETWNKLKGIGSVVYEQEEGELSVINFGSKHDVMYIWTGPDGSHCSTRVYDHGLVTLDIHYCVPEAETENHKQIHNMTFIKILQSKLKDYLNNDHINSLNVPIKRGKKVWRYSVSEDERLMEYDFTDVLVDMESQYQHITIVKSKQFGNMLYLDEDAMLSERDLIYTQTLCGLGQEDYRDKEVLILGGGDGGVLHELLKCHPKYVTMVEIDVDVINSCRVHMRKVCGNTMDEFEGDNYKIITEDCMLVLKEYIELGKKFDYIINDLTERTLGESSRNSVFDFVTTSEITEMSLRVLKKGAKLMSRGCAASDSDYSEYFERNIEKLGCTFHRKTVFVPSFLEDYHLYEVVLKE